MDIENATKAKDLASLLLDPNVLGSTIEGVCVLLAAIIPSIIGYVIFNKWQEKKQNDVLTLRLARQVQFFQAVEQVAIREPNLTQRSIRLKVKEEFNLIPYDQFTPKKLERLIENYEQRSDELVPTEQ
ncbi:hypothetical protein OCT63_17175 [Vibrio sp. RW]|uniref:hypothetical protein n=1 Tax=Vibrio sp. RW TaxID=2998833 RepID=UPI0022CD7755|nr:hypothetical protein [Vibrio sp. RW]MDA0145960.1 hypothetical protein [Vibrio sp. RW]